MLGASKFLLFSELYFVIIHLKHMRFWSKGTLILENFTPLSLHLQSKLSTCVPPTFKKSWLLKPWLCSFSKSCTSFSPSSIMDTNEPLEDFKWLLMKFPSCSLPRHWTRQCHECRWHLKHFSYDRWMQWFGMLQTWLFMMEITQSRFWNKLAQIMWGWTISFSDETSFLLPTHFLLMIILLFISTNASLATVMHLLINHRHILGW